MATHSSIPAWRSPWTEEPGGLQFIGAQRDRHDSSELACTHRWQPTRLCSPWDSPGKTELDMTEATQQEQQQHAPTESLG